MYVCICHGITERQILRAVEQGARSLSDVQMKLPVAGCCGRCEDSARELIRDGQLRDGQLRDGQRGTAGASAAVAA
jgi:bacterioferritin-associated ferredoxin